jgi:hypothetical protein
MIQASTAPTAFSPDAVLGAIESITDRAYRAGGAVLAGLAPPGPLF